MKVGFVMAELIIINFAISVLSNKNFEPKIKSSLCKQQLISSHFNHNISLAVPPGSGELSIHDLYTL